MSSKIIGLLKIARPKHWIKNFFCFAPLLFSGEFQYISYCKEAFVTFTYFCLASSCIYVLNDLFDLEDDRKHPHKSRVRPLASGIIKATEAWLLLGSLFLLVLTEWLLQSNVFFILLLYFALNIIYTLYAKRKPVIDIFIIASGFVLRVVAGSFAINAAISSWMLITTMCLALYLASIKRRQEIINVGANSRKVLSYYNVNLIDRYAEMSATGAIVFYSMYVLSVRPDLVYSIPLVLFGLFRYWYVVDIEAKGESPTDVLIQDGPLLASLFAWVLFCTIASI